MRPSIDIPMISLDIFTSIKLVFDVYYIPSSSSQYLYDGRYNNAGEDTWDYGWGYVTPSGNLDCYGSTWTIDGVNTSSMGGEGHKVIEITITDTSTTLLNHIGCRFISGTDSVVDWERWKGTIKSLTAYNSVGGRWINVGEWHFGPFAGDEDTNIRAFKNITPNSPRPPEIDMTNILNNDGWDFTDGVWTKLSTGYTKLQLIQLGADDWYPNCYKVELEVEELSISDTGETGSLMWLSRKATETPEHSYDVSSSLKLGTNVLWISTGKSSPIFLEAKGAGLKLSKIKVYSVTHAVLGGGVSEASSLWKTTPLESWTAT